MSETANKRSLSQALNSGVRKYGTAIVSNLAIAIKTSQLYSFAHQNVVQALRELEEYLVSFVRLEGSAELARIEDFLFINEVRIKVDLGGLQPYEFVLDLFRRWDVGKLTFSEGIDSKQLSKLIELLTRKPDGQDPFRELQAALASAGAGSIQIARYEAPEEQQVDVSDDTRILAMHLWFRAVQQCDDTFQGLPEGRKINLKRLKRTVQGMVDLILEDEPTLLALVNVKDHGSRQASHAVNVAILSVALGARLGFTKKLLGDLGIAALLHDVGKVALPQEVLEKDPEELPAEDRRRLENHVYTGVETLLDQRIVDAIVKSMNVAFLHHFRFDGTGYPRAHVVKSQNFYSRIVAVSDFYENRTRPSPGGGPAWPADRILRELMDRSGTEFDPLVVKAFVNLLGLYPVGCIVCLENGAVGSVVRASTSPRHLDRPVVRLFQDGGGQPVDETVNLMDRGPSGGFLHSIVKLHQQQEVELEMEEFLSVI